MRTLIFVFFAFFLSSNLLAQDLIVSQSGDSIRCKIDLIKNDWINFTQTLGATSIRGSISMENVKFYEKDFFADKKTQSIPPPPQKEETLSVKVKPLNPEPPSKSTEQVPQPPPSTEEKPKNSKVFLAVHAGYSMRINKIGENSNEVYKAYLKKLKQGYHIRGDIGFTVGNYAALGFQYSLYQAQNTLSGLSFTGQDGLPYDDGKLEDIVSIHFIAPTYYTKLRGKNGSYYSINAGLGYMIYNNLNYSLEEDYALRGKTFGSSLELGWAKQVTKQLELGIQGALLAGILKKIEVSNNGPFLVHQLTQGQYEGLSRIDLSIMIKYNIQ